MSFKDFSLKLLSCIWLYINDASIAYMILCCCCFLCFWVEDQWVYTTVLVRPLRDLDLTRFFEVKLINSKWHIELWVIVFDRLCYIHYLCVDFVGSRSGCSTKYAHLVELLVILVFSRSRKYSTWPSLLLAVLLRNSSKLGNLLWFEVTNCEGS